MLTKLRSRLTYANLMATVAVFLALGGGAYAAATAPKNSVVSRSIRNGQVKTQDLAGAAVKDTKIADNAVTTGKLADDAVTSSKLTGNSVTGLANIQDDSVTGQDVDESSLRFGCNPDHVSWAGAQGPFRIGNIGFCAFVIFPSSARTWSEAANDCSTKVPDSTLANPAQIAQLQHDNGGSQGPLTGTTGIWTADPAGSSPSTSVWTVSVGNGGAVSQFAAASITSTSSGPIACVYEPASKNG